MGDVGMNKARKAVGTNMARASNQKKSAPIKMKFAGGGMVGNTTNPNSASVQRAKGVGSGTPRGTGAATKGKHFGGCF